VWRESVGDSDEVAFRECVRRAVDLRDTLAETASPETTRALHLVDVLNHLGRLKGYDTTELWDRP
jgi:hypothetical protein